ncbi:MAG: hypothetical protein M3350_08485 [Actinomycetota bacterium]|nr:hypothetical protein [Actinomycetota bacterium]
MRKNNLQRERNSTESDLLRTPQPETELKLRILDLALPARSAVVFGDIYLVEGAYGRKCAESGCERVLVVDTLETPGWLGHRQALPMLDFQKGDFADPFFMSGIRERFEISIAFNVLLHQPPLLSTIHLVLDKTERAICIVQPMLKERDVPNSLVYLPGNADVDQLAPVSSDDPADVRAFSVEEVNHSHWIWGMTRSFLGSVLAGEGFEVTQEETGESLPNANWFWYGCVAERRETNPRHWSQTLPQPGVLDLGW